MSERTDAQLRVIKAVMNSLGAAGISAWLFGGWALLDRQPGGSSFTRRLPPPAAPGAHWWS
jgi:hypothetical protein